MLFYLFPLLSSCKTTSSENNHSKEVPHKVDGSSDSTENDIHNEQSEDAEHNLGKKIERDSSSTVRPIMKTYLLLINGLSIVYL